MPRSTVLTVAAVAFLIPICVVLFQHRERIAELNRIDPSQGHVIFFTSPG